MEIFSGTLAFGLKEAQIDRSTASFRIPVSSPCLISWATLGRPERGCSSVATATQELLQRQEPSLASGSGSRSHGSKDWNSGQRSFRWTIGGEIGFKKISLFSGLESNSGDYLSKSPFVAAVLLMRFIP